jgi:hypothetical protein
MQESGRRCDACRQPVFATSALTVAQVAVLLLEVKVRVLTGVDGLIS